MSSREPQPTMLGHYAGPASRLVAFVVDVALAVLVFTIAVAAALFVVDLVTSFDLEVDELPPLVSVLLLAAWLTLYFGGSWSASGRTPGMALFGLRVVDRDGSQLEGWRAFVRVPALALDMLTFGIGFIGIVIGREHRALHDVIAGTVVVYDWDARAARLRFLARRPNPVVQ